ncbi:MAG TPA: cardiolipin synthase [Candidatus Saccharibacteria bacterium]|nr:cardiolipin synthase [Candidatus Saccharibacteria bacterium]HMR38252.1 cardiolipin synthase [Candidatus Saccharibacteria bacterium]
MYALFIAWIVVEWLLRILALFVVPRNRKPTAGMAWLMFIFLLPEIGWVVFLILGSPKLPKNRRDAQSSLDIYIKEVKQAIMHSKNKKVSSVIIEPPQKYASTVSLSDSLTHLPLFAGNAIEPLPEYDEIIARIIEDVRSAKHYIQLEYFILALDTATEPLIEALEEAAERGVEVRVLYDAIGVSKYPRKKEMIARFAKAGIEAHPMLPLHFPGKKYTRPDLRNHRKLVVVDGRVGYTGSLNMIQRDYHRKDDIVYDELVVRIQGPVVLQLEAVFLNDWLAETGEVLKQPERDFDQQLQPQGTIPAHIVPSGPGYEYENNRKLFASLFYAAEKDIVLVNPYFVPDQSLITALIGAARRGVRVRLLNSEAIDQVLVAHAQRSYYEEMLRAGVEIYLYKKPTLLHSKFALIDDDACFVGSSNMDIRSFELNQELTLTCYDTAFVALMQNITDGYLKKSTKIHKKDWLSRPPRKQLLDNIARLTSSLQ